MRFRQIIGVRNEEESVRKDIERWVFRCALISLLILSGCMSVTYEGEGSGPEPEVKAVSAEPAEEEPAAPAEPAGQDEAEEEPQAEEGTSAAASAVASTADEAPKPEYRLAKVTSFLSNGVLDTVTEMVYQDGLLVEERILFTGGSFAGRISYTYDRGAVATSIKYDRFGNPQSIYNYAYDDYGNLTKEELLDSASDLVFAHRYSYDPENRRVKLEILSGDGFVLSYAEYKYANGKNHRVEMYNTAGEMKEYLDRSYNEADLPVLEIIADTDGKELEKVKLTYRAGKLVRKETYIHTRFAGSEEYTYDKADNLAVRTRFDRKGTIIETIEYSYVKVEK